MMIIWGSWLGRRGQMELIYVLDGRRLQRELRRREVALREAARAPEAEPAS
jgi:hypothetical protein